MKARKTDDERKADRDKRKADIAALHARFPGVRLATSTGTYGVFVGLKSGDNCWLEVGKRGDWDKNPRFSGWERASIYLDDDPIALAEFICALTARYNAIVEEMNGFIGKSKLTKAIEGTKGTV